MKKMFNFINNWNDDTNCESKEKDIVSAGVLPIIITVNFTIALAICTYTRATSRKPPVHDSDLFMPSDDPTNDGSTGGF